MEGEENVEEEVRKQRPGSGWGVGGGSLNDGAFNLDWNEAFRSSVNEDPD